MKPQLFPFDLQTIDVRRLYLMKRVRIPSYHRIVSIPGCPWDTDRPPGYPTYFCYQVVTKYKSWEPRRGSCVLFPDPAALSLLEKVRLEDLTWYEIGTIEQQQFLYQRFQRLFCPLLYRHERVQTWIKQMYAQYAGQYKNQRKGIGEQHFLCWNDLQQDEKKRKELFAAKHARALLLVRKWYPEHRSDISLLDRPPSLDHSHWWERCPFDERKENL